jgi:hypothetical protein
MRWAAFLFFFVCWATVGVPTAVGQSSPIPNAGFEMGNLTGWFTSCFGQDGGCGNWTVSVDPAYARNGRFGARLFNAQVGAWGHAQLFSDWFNDTSPTYTLSMKLVGGATQFLSGVILYFVDSTGRFVKYEGNALGSMHCYPLDQAHHCGLFRLVPGAWGEFTFDFQGDFVRKYGRQPTGQRYLRIEGYQADDFVEFYLDDLLVPRTQQSPIRIIDLTLSQSSARSCEVVTGIVTLSAPAPPEGAMVTIMSRNQAAPPPAPFLIPAGQTRGAFAFTTAFSPIVRDGWITASYGASARAADLTVRTSPVTTLTVQEETVLGGTTTLGTVQFPGPAAPEPLPITLVSSNPSVAVVPETVVMRSTTSVRTFEVSTAPVSTPTPVVLTAASPAGIATVRLVVVPPTENPGRLAAIRVDPNTVTGGSGATATVHLSGPAPPNGSVVTLVSDAATVLTLPANVTVPAGATSATVPLTTFPVAVPRTVTLNAALGGQSRMTTLTVNPPVLDRVSAFPQAVLGGGESAGVMVTLNGPAPPGGAMLALASSNPAIAEVPASTMIMSGGIGVSIPVSTAPVAASASAVISATWNGTTRSASLTVAPSGTLWLSIRDNQILGSQSTIGTVKLIGPPVTVPTVITLQSSNPTVVSVPAQVTLQPGENTATFLVTTIPVASQTTASITARTPSRTSTVSVSVLLPVFGGLAFRLQPAAVTGGTTAMGTVLLTGPAPAGGYTVVLSSENPQLASAPPSVLVPAGASTASFPVITAPVSNATYVSLSATFGGRTVPATIILAPGSP